METLDADSKTLETTPSQAQFGGVVHRVHRSRPSRERLECLVGCDHASDTVLRSVLKRVRNPCRHFGRHLGMGPKLSRLLGLEAPGRSRDRGLFLLRPESKHPF